MASPAAEALPFTDDILADILIRLPTLADFGCACASCPAFRRVITSPSFLRRLHALHAPLLLGFRSFFGFHPAEPPHPSAPVARAVAAAADFRFPFLPRPGYWLVRDARDGRFVLDRDEGRDDTFTTVAVCDPLFRRYVLLPPIPADMAATVQQPHLLNGERRCDIFLAPCSGEAAAAAGLTGSFTVVWMAQCPTKVLGFVFSSASQQWRAIPSRSWGDLNPYMNPVTERYSLLYRNYAYGRFYWYLSGFPNRSNLITLDMTRMEFSPINPPFNHRIEEFTTVELGDNRCGIFMFGSNQFYGAGDSVLHLFCAYMQNLDEGANKWVLENEILLPHPYRYGMLGVADGKLFLHTTEGGRSCISLDCKTSQFQTVQGMIHDGYRPLPALYVGYPPSLSLPTI
ncbi:hypothetical protein EJB05_11831, partial [Eragrostis curvula]